jgi:hypothetical protein
MIGENKRLIPHRILFFMIHQASVAIDDRSEK